MEKSTTSSFGKMLRDFRKRQKLSQPELAEKVGRSRATISLWERGLEFPDTKGVMSALVRVLRLDKVEERLFFEARYGTPAVLPYHHLPRDENPYFVGRDTLLRQLHEQFTMKKQGVTKQAISGLGGVGKTETALAYAHRYKESYHYILWATADSSDTLTAAYVGFADLLHLPERDRQDQNLIVAAVKYWLKTQKEWLLILDNIEDPNLVQRFVPSSPQGAVLLTTQLHVTEPIAQTIGLDTMPEEEGARLLLTRAHYLKPGSARDIAIDDATMMVAKTISREVGGLPLALDQAGAYIQQVGCPLAEYLALYREGRDKLLQKRGKTYVDHAASVTATFLLAISRVAQKHEVAPELLRPFAFLAPSDIPEEVVVEGAPHLGTTLQSLARDRFDFNDAIEALQAFSLIRRDKEKRTFSLHRLMQAVIQDGLLKSEQAVWVERVIGALKAVFPQGVHPAWSSYERLLPHVQTCATHSQLLKSPNLDLAALLFKIAAYLNGRAQHQRAESLYQQGLQIQEQALGPEHPDVVYPLICLAECYKERDKLAESEELYRRVLRIREQIPGSRRLDDLATVLNNLASLCAKLGKDTEAEELYWRALKTREQQLPPGHPDLTIPLNKLASFYTDQGRYAEAERLYQQSLEIREQESGPEHPRVVTPLKDLAGCYMRQGKHTEAEPLYQRVVHIGEQEFRPDSLDLVYPLDDLAGCYVEQGKLAEAEELYQRALSLCELEPGSEDLLAAYPLWGLAECRMKQGKYTEAEPFYQHALQIWEREDPEHPDVADPLIGLAECYREQGKYAEAMPLYQRALVLQKQALGPDHWKTVDTQNRSAALFREMEQQNKIVCLEDISGDENICR